MQPPEGTTVDSVIVSYVVTPKKDNPDEKVPLILVGRREPNNDVEIVNGYTGPEATALYELLLGTSSKSTDILNEKETSNESVEH